MAAADIDDAESSPGDLISFDCFYPTEFLHRWVTLHVTDADVLKELRSNRRYRETPQIEDYPCRVYLVDHEDTQRIRVWLQQSEVQVDKCSDYMDENLERKPRQPCWVCKWLDVNENWMVDPKELSNEPKMDRPDFYRLHGDRPAEFGDGGYAFLAYPVWIHEQLPVEEKRRLRLLDVLYQLNEERKDCHTAPSPVEDIIDPDLLPCRPPPAFNRDQWIERRMKQLQTDERKTHKFKRDLNLGEYQNLSEHEKLRDSYQWLPAEFVIDTDGKVDIRTPIHHLPVLPEYKKTYGDIAHVFHAMLPLFEQLKLLKTKAATEQRLQVIVKAQSYNLKAGRIIFLFPMTVR